MRANTYTYLCIDTYKDLFLKYLACIALSALMGCASSTPTYLPDGARATALNALGQKQAGALAIRRLEKYAAPPDMTLSKKMAIQPK